MASRAHLGIALVIAGLASVGGGGGACTCSKGGDSAAADASASDDATASSEPRAPVAVGSGGLSAPIAGARGEQGDVVVAGLDVAASAIRVQRISAKDEIVADRTVFDGA